MIAGVDEAGRGPLAGPVVAAAVILDPRFPIVDLDDSKRLTARQRGRLEDEIQRNAIAWAVTRIEPDRIDKINILQATMQAMALAVNGLTTKPAKVLIDGNRCPELDLPAEAIVGGDALEPAISAASILAKEARDRIMRDYAEIYPQYGFERHMGYPTKAHLDALATYGPCPLHRRSFGPVRRVCERTGCPAGNEA